MFLSPVAHVPAVFNHLLPNSSCLAASVDHSCGESISAGQLLAISFAVTNSNHPLLANGSVLFCWQQTTPTQHAEHGHRTAAEELVGGKKPSPSLWDCRKPVDRFCAGHVAVGDVHSTSWVGLFRHLEHIH